MIFINSENIKKAKHPFEITNDPSKKTDHLSDFNSHMKEISKHKSATSNLKKTTDTTSKSSIESSFMSLIFKEFMKNMNKSFNNIYERYTEVSYYHMKNLGR